MAGLLNVCRFTPTAGGTADFTYSSAIVGYQSPSAAGVVNGRLYKYRAESADLSQWENGEGAYNTGTGVLTRATVLFNSAGSTSKINFTLTPSVGIVLLKEDLISIEEANSFTPTQQQQARTNIGWPDGQIPATSGTTQPGTGKVGELITGNGSINFSASGTPVNVTSATITPGVWDIELDGVFSGAGATTSNDWIAVISTASGSVVSGVVYGWHERAPGGLDFNKMVTSPRKRVAVSVNTTYYLNVQATYSGGVFSFGGTLAARRV